MPRRINCQESDVACPCTFGRAGIDWCRSFFALLVPFDCIRSGSLEHMQFVCPCRASMCPSSRLQERCLPEPKHLSVSIQNISHRLFISASTSLKMNGACYPCQASRSHSQHSSVLYLQTHGLAGRTPNHYQWFNLVSIRANVREKRPVTICTLSVTAVKTRL